MARWCALGALVLSMGGCRGGTGAQQPKTPENAAVPAAEDSPADSDPSPHEKSFQISPELSQVLDERGLNGAIALYDTESRTLMCSAKDACDVSLGPASTYKVAHSLIGLELGELESAEHVFRWDKKEYSVPAWNQDHTLRSAMEVSCVPCFRQLARKIGEERMSAALHELEYGNETVGGPIDNFWLEGGALRITPRQQIEFLYRLQTRALPFSASAMETAIDVIPRAEGDGTILRGKTGMYGSKPPVGWYVGWLEWKGGTTFFATALHGENDLDELPAVRREVTVESLRRFTKLDGLM